MSSSSLPLVSSSKIISSSNTISIHHKFNCWKIVGLLLVFVLLLQITTPAFSTSITEKTKPQQQYSEKKALHKKLLEQQGNFQHHHNGLINNNNIKNGNNNNLRLVGKKNNFHHHERKENVLKQQEQENLKRKVSTIQASVVPTFSLPSVVNLYTNTPLYIPIILTNEVTSGTTFEYSWKVYNSTNGITLASGTTPTVYVGEYDLDIMKTVTFYQNVVGSISSPVTYWNIDVEVTSRGDYGIIIAQYKKTIPFNLYLLGVLATIVGESQEMTLITDLKTNQYLNVSMSTITPKIEYYDSAVSKLVKSNGQCSLTCTYTLISSSEVKNCSNFDAFRTLSNANCKPFSVIGKSEEDISNVEKFNIGITYKYSSFYYVESDKYEILIHTMRANDSVPIFQSISSNTSMQQYHPPNLPITLTPNFVNYNNTARVVLYWEVNGSPYLKQNLTLDSLSANTKYVAKCDIYFLGNIQRKTSMTYTFFTANTISKPTFNIVTSSAVGFRTRVQISGYIGETSRGPLCMTEIFAETTSYGKISLTNGRPICLQSLLKTSSDAILFIRLPLRRITLYDTIKLSFVVTDGISQESFSVTTSSNPSTILDYFSSANIVKLTSSVLDTTSTLYENDRALLPSHIMVAASLIMDFKASAEESNSMNVEYSTLASGLGTYLSRLCSSSASYSPLEQNLNCIELIGKYVSISGLTTTFGSTSLSQSISSNIVTLTFYQLNQLVFNSINGKDTLQNGVLFQKFSTEGGESYVSLLIDMLQTASNYISQDYTTVPINGTYVSINSNTITSTIYAVSKIFLSTSSSSTFKSSSSLITLLNLSSFKSSTQYSLSFTNGDVSVQLPPLSSVLGGFTTSSSVVLSFQISPQNNFTDSVNTTIISSRKVQFQLVDPNTDKKIELKDLSQPITLKLPITYSPLTNSSRDSSKCVFWSDSSNAWSNTGCTLKQATQSDFYCECNHTTTFAVLSSTITTSPNNTQIVTTSFDMIPLIVISSVTGGVILITLVFSGVLQAFIHILKNVDSAESGDLFLPAEFFPVNAKIEKPKEPEATTIEETEKKEEKEPKVKKRYKDLSFGLKIFECLKEFHPVLGIVFPKKYFKSIHIKRLDRLIILMDIFITTSTVNVILLSVSLISKNWIFVIPSLISFGCSAINQIPITLLFCKKQAIWKVCAYGYSCVFAFACLVISIIASAGVFVSNQWNMNILDWLYATILGVAWDLIVFRIVLASIIAFLIEVKVTIDLGIAAFRKNHPDTELEEQPLQTKRMVTVQNNVRIPMLFSQKEKPNIPKLNLKAVEGVATPKENPVNELSSMHASPTASDATSSSSGVDSYFSPHKANQPAGETKENSATVEEAKTSSSGAEQSSDHSTSKEVEQQCDMITPGCIVVLDSPGLSPISPLIPKQDHDMSFVEKVQLRDELNVSNSKVDEAIIPPVLEDTMIVDVDEKQDDVEIINEPVQEEPVKEQSEEEKPIEQVEEVEENLEIVEVEPTVPAVMEIEQVEKQVEEITSTTEVLPTEEIAIPEKEEPADEEIIAPPQEEEPVYNFTVVVDEAPEEEIETVEPVVTEPAAIEITQLPEVEHVDIEPTTPTEQAKEELTEIDTTKKNPIQILKEILKEKEAIPAAVENKPQEPKDKSEKNILEYIEQVSDNENKVTENLENFTSEILDRLSGKSISEILLILSETNDQQASNQQQYSSPMRTNSPVARNALQKNTPGNKSARMLKSGGIEIDRTRKRSLSFNRLYGIEEIMIKPQTDFFDQLRFYIHQNYSAEAKTKALNELLFLQCIYLHYKIISVTPETRKELAEQVVATFLNEKEQYHINIGFYKRVLASCINDENLNANTFERACEIIEIALKGVISNFLKHTQESSQQPNEMTSV